MQQTLTRDKKYSGCYVALEDFNKTVVTAYGKDPQKVYEEAVKRGCPEPVLIFVPAKDMVHIY